MEEKVQRLSEGMDFIEESVGYGEPLTFTEVNENIISESTNSKPSPFKILGRCCGNFQPIGEFSRNKRLYSEDLWPTVLQNEEFKSRLAHRAVFGCLGHADKLVDDRDIQEGKVSHIVTLLEVRKNEETGKPFLYGELEILDTPAGRILEAMYRGGADLYVSSRAAGRLVPVPGQNYALVKPDQYHVHCFDVVCRPGFLQARPTFEAVSTGQPQPTIHESATSVSATVPTVTVSAIAPTATTTSSWAVSTSAIAPTIAESKEVEALKDQVSKLTKIIEKVVDDVYEENEVPVAEQLTELLDNPEISESAYEDVISILKESKPELVNAIMENSRNKFNGEHAEKTGLKIDYYRFGGTKPYKIVPKDKSYFEASWDSPRYRTLKQAQKHVLDSYNKPKEENRVDKNEALVEAIARIAGSNISEDSFEMVLDMLKKGIN